MTNVLVVDPGELGELLSTLLEQYGLSAQTARTGEAALQAALESQPRVVVIEADLPDADGLDIADLLRAELESKIVLTYAPERAMREGDAFRARLLDVDVSFARPFRSLSLIEQVAALMGPQEAVGAADAPSPLERVRDVSQGRGQSRPNDANEVALEGLVALEDLDLSEDEPRPDDEGPADEDDFGALLLDDIVVDVVEPTEEREAAAQGPSREEAARQDRDALADMFDRLRQTPTDEVQPPDPLAPARPATPSAGQGPLTPRVLTDLLDAFHQSRMTGSLELRRGREVRQLRFADGRIVAARSNRRSESFARVLGQALGPEVEARVAARGASPGPRDARAAGVSVEDIRATVLAQLRLVAERAFAWSEGSYRVIPGGRAASERAVSLGVGDVILRGILDNETPAALNQAAPDDARFAPSADAAYRLEDLTLTGAEARVVMAVDGTKTVDDIGTLFTDLDDRHRRGLIAGLFRLGVLRFAGWGPAKPRAISFF